MSKPIFASNLCYLMRKRKITPSALAQSLRVSKSAVGHWRNPNSKVYPAMPTFIDLLDILDYRDLNILTVNIERAGTVKREKPLPAEVQAALREIVDKAKAVLKAKA